MEDMKNIFKNGSIFMINVHTKNVNVIANMNDSCNSILLSNLFIIIFNSFFNQVLYLFIKHKPYKFLLWIY